MEINDIENAIAICQQLDLIDPVQVRNWQIRKEYLAIAKKRLRYGRKTELLERLGKKYFLSPTTIHSIVWMEKRGIKQRKLIKDRLKGETHGTKNQN